MTTQATAQPSGRPPVPASDQATRKLARRNTLVGLSFIAPNFIGFAVITLVPVVISLVMAFTKWDAYNPPQFVGINNFVKLSADETFWIALRNTIVYTVGHVPLTMAAALVMALVLNRKLRGIGFFRTAAFFPYVTSMVAVAVVWNMLFEPSAGPINQLLRTLGWMNPPGWTSSTDWALPAIIITSVWRDMGYYMILYLAGLQAVPAELYEAASIDGASKWRQFWNVTWPGLRPTTFFVTIMLTIGAFKIFDLVVIMTDGGPGRASTVLSQLIYREGILEGNYGYSSAISLVLFLLVFTVTVVQFRVQQKQEA